MYIYKTVNDTYTSQGRVRERWHRVYVIIGTSTIHGTVCTCVRICTEREREKEGGMKGGREEYELEGGRQRGGSERVSLLVERESEQEREREILEQEREREILVINGNSIIMARCMTVCIYV